MGPEEFDGRGDRTGGGNMNDRENDWRDYQYEWLLARVEVLEDMVRTFIAVSSVIIVGVMVLFLVGWWM